jgi:hypothetical protein
LFQEDVMLVIVATLLVALAAPVWGPAPKVVPASAAPASAASSAAAANAGRRPAASIQFGATAATAAAGNDSGVPEGVFQAAPEGLGLAAVTAAGVNITWFDSNEWDVATPTASTVPTDSATAARNAARKLAQGPNYTLTLVGKFAAPVNRIDGGTVEKAVTDTGEDLLGSNPHGFRPYLHQRYEEGKMQPAKVFSGAIRLAAPGEKATTIKELSGRVYYTVLGKSKVVNLGLTEFKAGAKGTEFGVEVEGFDERNGRLVLKLKFSGLPENVKIGGFKFYGPDGTALSVPVSNGLIDKYSKNLNFYCSESFPAKGRIEVEVYDNVQKLEAPFKLENVPLYGRPARPGA